MAMGKPVGASDWWLLTCCCGGCAAVAVAAVDGVGVGDVRPLQRWLLRRRLPLGPAYWGC